VFVFYRVKQAIRDLLEDTDVSGDHCLDIEEFTRLVTQV
jgi:hypothetical protein